MAPRRQDKQRLLRWQLGDEDATKPSSSSSEDSPLLGHPALKTKDKTARNADHEEKDGPGKRYERKRIICSTWLVIGTLWLGLLHWLSLFASKDSQRNPNRSFAPTIVPTVAPTTTTIAPTVTATTSPTAFPTMAPTPTPPPRDCPRHFRNPLPSSIVVGDASRGQDFAASNNDNLVFCESFDNDDDHDQQQSSPPQLWHADHSLFGEGNGGFAYYTPDNVATHDGLLHIRPGLFTDLGMIPTRQRVHGTMRTVMVPAADLMTGNCQPFPECATLDLNLTNTSSSGNCTIADFDGCQRIGTPLVTLIPVTSGRISTKGRFAMLYGRVEARIRLPQGDWLWPALWFMPVNESKYCRGWPDSGEFDLLASKGNDPNVYGPWGGGRNMFSSCLHYNGNSWWKTRNSLLATDILPSCRNGSVPSSECDWSTEFFTIGLYWSPTRMYAYALREDEIAGNMVQEEVKLWEVDATGGFGPDDFPLGSKFPPFFNEESTPDQNPQGPYTDSSPNKNAPFDQPFYLILNLSVGGESHGCPSPGYWGPDAVWCTQRDPNNPQEAARTVFWKNKDLWYPFWQTAKERGRDSFAVDWIKVWQ